MITWELTSDMGSISLCYTCSAEALFARVGESLQLKQKEDLRQTPGDLWSNLFLV